MTDNFSNKGNVFSENDALDINELASLNDDFSIDFLDQLQNQIAQSANITNDGAMFEETTNADGSASTDASNQKTSIPSRININDNFDDNFIKKYKARLNKQEAAKESTKDKEETSQTTTPSVEEQITNPEFKSKQENAFATDDKNKKISKKDLKLQKAENEDIEKLTNGNISEKPLDVGQVEYNESLDLLDGNVKYSKYVIYIDPENAEFIDSLTVKERKNLINKILKEQDVIVTTRHRFKTLQSIIKHAVVAIITITISVPLIYFLINASLEATVSNYQRSKANFKILYKEKGKIKKELY